LESIPTALRAGKEDLTLLRRFVRQTLREDPQWQRLLRDLKPPAPARAVTHGDDDD
jgi:hypothetical protein